MEREVEAEKWDLTTPKQQGNDTINDVILKDPVALQFLAVERDCFHTIRTQVMATADSLTPARCK